MKIDSHQHFWQFTEEDYGWIGEDQSVLRRDFFPQDLKPVLAQNNLDACIAVQARQSDIETQWLLELAQQNTFIKGVVGWIDIAADNLPEQLKQYQGNKLLKGFRHVLQDEPEAGFMLREKFVRGLKILAEQGYRYDLLIFANQLPEALQLLKQLPDLPIVLDHIAKPDIKTGHNFADWKTNIEKLSQYANVMCKVSGMVTEADCQNWQAEDFYPYLDVIFGNFGADRVMYGSDWPVCLLGGDYSQIKSIVQAYVNANYKADFDKIFGLNAAKFYQID
ncbi:amidohydrolase family protein [Catenovulum sediminis]|uniref:amidohydrolase family protein n=1 Tax=Catenovulum sediminis TaxID=1740262 RepID=UPI00117F1691|nr:amidohydrolase family protein [Catenovulum sediminis]